jgi:glutamyl-tRNA reductase
MSALGIVLVGVDFRCASTRFRAALALDRGGRGQFFQTLCSNGADGLVVLETCNRTEWLVASDEGAWIAQLLDAKMQRLWAEFGGERPRPFVHQGEAAARHLLEVAAGLQSFVPGERQIAGQVQSAFGRARADGQSNALLNILGSCAGRVVRKGQRRRGAAAVAKGVHTLAVRALQRRLEVGSVVAVVGLGAIGRRCADSLAAAGFLVRRFNRSPRSGAEALSALGAAAASCAAIVVATAAQQPWLDAEPLGSEALIIDLGSPGQVIAASCGPEATLMGLDELLVGRAVADASLIEALGEQVDQGVIEFRLSVVRRGLRHLVEQNHRTYEALAYRELPEALAGIDAAQARGVEERMRGLLRRYSRAMLEAVEASVVQR